MARPSIATRSPGTERVLEEIDSGGAYDLAQLTAARRALRELTETE